MPAAIESLSSLDLTGTGADNGFDVGAHAPSRMVYVARARNGSVKLQGFRVEADGSFTSTGSERTVGTGDRTRLLVFENGRMVVVWRDAGTLRARGFAGGTSGVSTGGDAVTVETTIEDVDLASIGQVFGVPGGSGGGLAYQASRQFAMATQGAAGGWKLWLGSVDDQKNVELGPVAAAGAGDKVSLACASLNETRPDGSKPRKAFTLWRDGSRIRTRSWRMGFAGVTTLASAAETRLLGTGRVHGMSTAEGEDLFATVDTSNLPNDPRRLQLVSVAADGAMSVYATGELTVLPVFAPFRPSGPYAAVAYQSDGRLGVAAWRFARPGGSGAARTVLASKVGLVQPTQFRLGTMVTEGSGEPVVFVTLARVASGKLVLQSWEYTPAVQVAPAGPTVAAAARKRAKKIG